MPNLEVTPTYHLYDESTEEIHSRRFTAYQHCELFVDGWNAAVQLAGRPDLRIAMALPELARMPIFFTGPCEKDAGSLNNNRANGRANGGAK